MSAWSAGRAGNASGGGCAWPTLLLTWRLKPFWGLAYTHPSNSTDWGCFPEAGFDLRLGRTFVLMLQGVWLVRERALPENFLFLLLMYATSAHTYVPRNHCCSYYPYYREYLFWSQLLSHDSTSNSFVWPRQPLPYFGTAVSTVVSQELSSVRTPQAGVLLSDQVPSECHWQEPQCCGTRLSPRLRPRDEQLYAQDCRNPKALPRECEKRPSTEKAVKLSVTPLESWKVSTLPRPAPSLNNSHTTQASPALEERAGTPCPGPPGPAGRGGTGRAARQRLCSAPPPVAPRPQRHRAPCPSQARGPPAPPR